MPNISVYHKCDNRCVMCSNPRDFIQSPAKDFSLARLSRRLKNFSLGRNVFLENFRDAFILSGGEPTMSPDLFPVIRRVATLFPQAQITCLTNGRAFSREAYAREFMRRFPLVNLVIPVHGHTASLHDRITRV
jgi:molybdenum cofactor biosynthesis enzyme MoaA